MKAAVPADRPAPPSDRSRRIYVYWAVGFAFLAALALVCWLVVGPVMSARVVVEEITTSCGNEAFPSTEQAAPYIARLGGPEEAARKLGLFLRLPKWASGANDISGWGAVVLLGKCGRSAFPTLGSMLDSRDERAQALAVLGVMIFCLDREGRQPSPPVSSLPVPWAGLAEDVLTLDFSQRLELATKDEDPQIRAVAAKALNVWNARLAAMSPKPY